jgi:uncharacterized membrane protein
MNRRDDPAAGGASPVPWVTRLSADLREPGPAAPLAWVVAGWRDFRAHPRESLAFGACFTLGGYLLAGVLHSSTALFAALVTGFLLVGPALALGLYELSRQREQGENISLPRALAAFQGHLANIGLLSVMLGVVLLLWGRASMVIFAVFYTSKMPSWAGFLAAFTQLDKLDFILAWVCVGGFFAALAFSVSVISIPLMLDRPVDAVSAALISMAATLQNPWTMLVWGMLIVMITVIGFATAFIGLLVTMPVLGHATWHAYRAFLPAGPEGD